MDFGIGPGLIVVVGVLALVVLALAIVGARGLLGRGNAVDEAPQRAPEPPPPSPAPSNRLSDRLNTLHKAGRSTDVLRLLDQTLPEWVVSASLIETARELGGLEEGIARARGNGVSEEVTGRLALQAETVSTDLWSLAERIAAADRIGSSGPREALQQHDEALVRLLGGIREAREGLAELSLSDLAGWEDLRSAGGRFRSLAATARELHEWEREQVPW